MNFFSFMLHTVILGACFILYKMDLTPYAFLLFGFYILFLISEIESAVFKVLDLEKRKKRE